jgi:hypothetical protein
MRRPARIAGAVVDDRGNPVAGAHVSLGHRRPPRATSTARSPSSCRRTDARDPWIAVKTAIQPAMQEPAAAREERRRRRRPSWSSCASARRRSRSRAASSDAEGRGQSGLEVFVSDPTFFGAFDEIPAARRGTPVRRREPRDLEKLMANAPAGSEPEALLRTTSSVFWTFARTDRRRPASRLGGLLDRAYGLSALDRASLLRARHGSRCAPEPRDVEIRLPEGAYLKDVRGRVVTKSGQPVRWRQAHAAARGPDRPPRRAQPVDVQPRRAAP